MRSTSAICAVLLLSACSSTSPQRIAAIDRALADAPGEAQPSVVIATEIAAARTAREDGQLAALLDFAAPGAVLHLASGVVDAQGTLSRASAPALPARSTTRAVWMSCDGQSAVSFGNYAGADDRWGRYAAAWQRQRGGEYRWTYGIAAPDPALTASETKARPTTDDAQEIVVEGTTMIRGETGDCLRGAPPPPSAPSEAADGSGVSPDNTLVWRWRSGPGAARSLTVSQYRTAGWEQVFAMTVGSDGKVSAIND